LKKLLSQTEGFVFIDWFKFIFFNNIKSSFLSLVGGIFFGAIPLFATIVNGFLIGFVSNLSVSAEGVISLWKLVPHGIFEIPAIFISFACGLRFGTFVFQKDIKKSFQNYFIGGMRVFFLIVLPLLIVAGIIESALIFFGN
jgi:stage II sporulation protein M